MNALLATAATASHLQSRPALDSQDSAIEFSLYHWIEVCRLVDEGDAPFENEGHPEIERVEEALEEALLEMEPATAY